MHRLYPPEYRPSIAPLPTYAQTFSDQQFEQTLTQIPPQYHNAARQANEEYWTAVNQLRARTQNFWEPADLLELEQLKERRRETLKRLKGDAQ